jgi:hypothetical protein
VLSRNAYAHYTLQVWITVSTSLLREQQVLHSHKELPLGSHMIQLTLRVTLTLLQHVSLDLTVVKVGATGELQPGGR